MMSVAEGRNCLGVDISRSALDHLQGRFNIQKRRSEEEGAAADDSDDGSDGQKDDENDGLDEETD